MNVRDIEKKTKWDIGAITVAKKEDDRKEPIIVSKTTLGK